MPSHPDRVRRNYCEHEYQYYIHQDCWVCNKCAKVVARPDRWSRIINIQAPD